MNPDSSDFAKLPRAEVEAKITALLLGELEAAEAAALEAYVAQDSELAQLRAALMRTMELVREATTPARPAGASAIPRHQLSPERRERLLARLRARPSAADGPPIPVDKVAPAPFAENGWAAPTIFRLLLAACLVAVLGLAALWLSWQDRELGSPRMAMADVKIRGYRGSLVDFGAATNRAAIAPATSPPAAGAWVMGTVEAEQRPVSGSARGNGLARSSAAPEAAGETVHFYSADAGYAPAPSVLVAPAAPVRIEAPPLPQAVRRYGLGADEPPVRMRVEARGREASGSPAGAANAPIAAIAAAPAAASPLSAGAVDSARRLSDRNAAVPTAGRPSAAPRSVTSERLASRGVNPVDSTGLIPPSPGDRVEPVPLEPGQVNFAVPVEGYVAMERRNAGALAETEKGREELKVKRETAKLVERIAAPGAAGGAAAGEAVLGYLPSLGRRLAPAAPVATESIAAPVAGLATEPVPEVVTAENAFSTFSLNVSDVSFKLAAESLKAGNRPAPETIRSEEFINAFQYRDPEPGAGFPLAFAWDRARHPFAQQRDFLRLAVRTAALGREAGRPLNLVLLLDNSGSMERADRVRIRREAVRVLSEQLKPEDRISVVAFARTARLWVDGLSGGRASELGDRIGNLAPEGGTDLGEALRLGYEVARKHFLPSGGNRVVLLTDGAANLGDVEPQSLQTKVEENRRRGIALDCFGIGWEGYNDDLLEVLSRHGDGRYGFINTVESAASDFAGQLAGALQVAAADVKVQVEFNPRRVLSWRQVGYTRHQLAREQFRDNTVDAAEIGAAESGNALYVIAPEPRGDGPLATVRVRFRVPATGQFEEHAWVVPYVGTAPVLEQAGPALRLAAVAGSFAEWLENSPYAGDVHPDRLLALLNGVPAAFDPDPRPGELEWMIRQAQSLAGR